MSTLLAACAQVMRFLSSMEKEGSVYLGYQYAADAPTAPATARVMLQFLKDDGGVLDRRELWRLCHSNRDIQDLRPSTVRFREHALIRGSREGWHRRHGYCLSCLRQWLHHLQGLVRRKAVNVFFYRSENDEEEEAAAAAGV